MRAVHAIVGILGAGLLAGPLCGWGAGERTMNVQVQKAELRASPSPLGAIVGSAGYGDTVHVLEEKGAWVNVVLSEGTATGWMHQSALTRQRIRLRAGEQEAEVRASSGEQALAGKGFNKDVEEAFKAKNRNANYAWVDQMVEFRVSPEQMRAFLQQGRLQGGQGGTP